MLPLAPDLPVAKRQSALTALLARVQQNDRRAGPKQPIPQVAEPPAQEKISAFDDRWSTPAKPLAQTPPPQMTQSQTPALPPPAEPAQEKISAFDDRWSTPQKPVQAAPPVVAQAVAAKPAAAAAPSGDRGKKLQTLLDRIQRAGRRAR